uniref:Uncharacterized protein TCIL3000_10_13540 n=1 Tax=Trypanosoma congolense (strain IL3000) TaxID=1068625 RepID=G0UYV3_TRYCI|nr:unnamed protein product [Trypanosoma congolense IL3000]
MSGLASDNISATSIRVHGVLRDRDTCVFCGKRSTPPPNDPFAPVFAFFSLVDCAHYACQPCALVHCDNAGRHIRCPTCCVVSRLAQSGRRRGHRVDERVSIDDGVSSAASHSIRRPQMPLRSAFAPAGRRRRTNSVQFPENLVKSTSHSDGTVVSGTSVFNSALTLRAVGRLPADPSYSKNMESKKGTTAASSEEQVSVNLYTIRATSTKHRKRVTVNRSHSLPLPPTEHRYLQPSAPFHHPPPLVIRTVEEEEEVLASFQLIVREIEQTIIATLAKEEEERKIIATAEEHRRGSIHRLYESHERQRLARQNTLLEEFSDSRISPRSTTNASEDQVSASSNEEEMDIHRTQSKYIVQGSQEEAPPTPLHVQPNLKQITKEQLKNGYSLEGQKEEKQNKSVTNESHIRRNDSGNTQQMQEQNIMAKEEEQNKQSTITEELRARDILCSDESSERAMYATDERRERVEAAMWNSEQQLRLLEQLVDLVREEQQQRVKIQRDEARLQAEMERAEVNDVTAIRATIEAVAETLRREQEGVLRDEGEERYDIQEEERRTRRLIVRKSSEYPIDISPLRAESYSTEDTQRESEMPRGVLEFNAPESAIRARINLIITEELRARDILCSDESSERAMYATDERRERVEAAMWNSEQQLRLLEQLVDLVREEQQQRVKIQRDEARLQAEMERAEVNDVTAIRATIEAMAETLRREQEGVLRDEGEERYDIQEEERRTRRLIVRKSSEYPIDISPLRAESYSTEDTQRESEMPRGVLEFNAPESAIRARINLIITEELRARDILCSDESSERAMYATDEHRERVEAAMWNSEQQLRLLEQLVDLVREEQQQRVKIQRDEARLQAEMERTCEADIEAMADTLRREQEGVLRDEDEERYDIQEEERRIRRLIVRKSSQYPIDISPLRAESYSTEDTPRESEMPRGVLEFNAPESAIRARINLIITEELRARDILCSDESSERAMYATDERRERVEAAMWNSEQQLRLLEQLVDLVREEQQQRVKIQRDEARLQAEMERAEMSTQSGIR